MSDIEKYIRVELGEWEYLQEIAASRLQLLSRAMNALEGWRILLDMPITEIMKDIEKELGDDND